MIGSRRTSYNFALQRAVHHSRRLDVPLLVVEPLRLDYPWACARFHHFVLDGMLENWRALEKSTVTYYPFVEEIAGDANGMFTEFANAAAVVVSDDTPAFFLPNALRVAAEQCPVTMEAVDGVGIYPLRETNRVFTTAASFRRHLQKELPELLMDAPARIPLLGRKPPTISKIPRSLSDRWPMTPLSRLRDRRWLARLSINHRVGATSIRGGAASARSALADFVQNNLPEYASQRNQLRAECQSHLSPYLHFGHISAHEVFRAVLDKVDWSPAMLAPRATGSRHGWWGAGESVESFLDQLVTWRELGHNAATHQSDYRRFESIPNWAQETLQTHASDERPYLYPLEALEGADTHDPLWNAAQSQLVTEGTIHNYLRMLWGKKILEWTPDPHIALSVMIELNNKYALDGRDPNSYSGILWVLGKYDRAWGPERPIFGKVRYMSSDNTARKLDVRSYVERYRAA
jgi:deoxyribodipyrimidine photo-lyase